MTPITPQSKVGDLAAENLLRTRVFQQNGIDFCCGGGQPLETVCRKKKLDIDTLIKQLEEQDSKIVDERESNLNAWSTRELVDNIVSTHHAFLRQELPQIRAMAQKVADVHGELHPELHQILRGFLALEREMGDHMSKEESILFPMCVSLEQSDEKPEFHCGSVASPIRVMEMEHDTMASFFEDARKSTNDLTPPEGACMTYRAYFKRLLAVESDLHLHTHKENNVLFPRAIMRENELLSSSKSC
jgi:regulator of cell morphogenesis and NO signaling